MSSRKPQIATNSRPEAVLVQSLSLKNRPDFLSPYPYSWLTTWPLPNIALNLDNIS